jgi:hypothetical protein
MNEWVSETRHVCSCYNDYWAVNDVTAGVFVVSVISRLSLLGRSLVLEWHQNPIRNLSCNTTIPGQVSMAFTFVVFCHKPGFRRYSSPFHTCVRILTVQLRLWVTLHSLFLLFLWLRWFIGYIRAWFLSVGRICVWLGTKFSCLRLRVVFEWSHHPRFNVLVCNRAWWFDRVDKCVMLCLLCQVAG